MGRRLHGTQGRRHLPNPLRGVGVTLLHDPPGVHDVPMRVVFNVLHAVARWRRDRKPTGPCHLDDSNLATDVVRVIDPQDVLPAHRSAVLLADAGKQEASVFIGDRSLHAC